jgi:hypothetical protein
MILLKAQRAAPGRIEILTALARVCCWTAIMLMQPALHPEDALTRADLAACQLEAGERSAGEANLRMALRGRPHMLGRATYALVQSSHGRFFFRQSAFAKFLHAERPESSTP